MVTFKIPAEMRRIVSSVITVLLIVSGCAMVETEELLPDSYRSEKAVYYAAFGEQKTRVQVEDGNALEWTSDDRITVFNMNSGNSEFRLTGTTESGRGQFEVISVMEGTDVLERSYAVYPYDEAHSIDPATGTLTVNLPEVQHYLENSFGLGANVMVAVTEDADDDVLNFRNVCGYLKLKLYAEEEVTVAKVTLRGKAGEKIAGKANVTASFGDIPTVEMTEVATQTITLVCDEGVSLSKDPENPTVFWFVVPETTFSEGLSITVTDPEGRVFDKNTSNEIKVERNTPQPMAALMTKCSVPSNQIWYTTTDNSQISPSTSSSAFGTSQVVSNEFDQDNGRWVLTFDQDLSVIGNDAFYGKSTLSSVMLPDCITEIGNRVFFACSSLAEIHLPDALKHIGYRALSQTALTDVVIPEGVQTLDYEVFQSCKSLVSVTFPETVVSLGYGIFEYCSALTSVSLPESLLEIGRNAFHDCDALTEITIPGKITTLPEQIFYQSGNLAKVTLPAGLKHIGRYAFNQCSSLPEIDLPEDWKQSETMHSLPASSLRK